MKRFIFPPLLLGAALALLGASSSAWAALAIVAHPSNTLAGVTAEETAEIYLGKTVTLADGRRVTPVEQPAGSAARAKFYKSVVKKDEGEIKAYWSKMIFTGKGNPPRVIGDDATVKAFVAGNPEAIGYVDGKAVDASVKVLLIVP